MKGNFLLVLLVLSHTLYAQLNPRFDSSKDSVLSAAREIMLTAKNCALITYSSTGHPRARTMDPFAPDSSMTVWLATNPRSEKVSEIKKNGKVALYYFDSASPGYVSISGHAEMVNSKIMKDSLWKEGWENFYKDRGADYILIKVVPVEIEVASYRHNLLGEERTWKAPRVKMR